MKSLALYLIRFYQYAISPMFGSSCRFHPTCSAYCHEAIATHGFFKGTWLGIKRIARCHPWAQGGVDPVPTCTCDNRSHIH